MTDTKSFVKFAVCNCSHSIIFTFVLLQNYLLFQFRNYFYLDRFSFAFLIRKKNPVFLRNEFLFPFSPFFFVCSLFSILKLSICYLTLPATPATIDQIWPLKKTDCGGRGRISCLQWAPPVALWERKVSTEVSVNCESVNNRHSTAACAHLQTVAD